MNRQTAAQTNQSAEITPLLASGILQRKCACGQHTVAGGKCDECGRKQLSLQRATRNSVPENRNGVPPIVHEVLNSSGQPLDTATRGFFEPRFGHDFSRVRVHTDSQAAESARAVNALAYTVGNEIVFGPGQYAPDSHSGQRLIGHELTHTVQQGNGLRHESSSVSEVTMPVTVAEQEADNAADSINGRHPVIGLHPVRLARQYSAAISTVPTYATSTPNPHPSASSSRVKTTSQPNPLGLSSLFSRFVKMLGELDKRLQGNATQAWGMIIHGEGDGRDSPATKASKDAKIWGSFDYAGFMELMNLVLLAIPETLDYRKKLENFRDGLDPKKIFKDPQKAAEFFKEKVEEVVEIKKKFGDTETRKAAGVSGGAMQEEALATRSPVTGKLKAGATLPTKVTTTPPPHKVEVGQWAASDLSGNTFIMIKYSDGSKRFVMGSIFGIRDIDDPGPLDWKKVRGSQTGTVPPVSK